MREKNRTRTVSRVLAPPQRCCVGLGSPWTLRRIDIGLGGGPKEHRTWPPTLAKYNKFGVLGGGAWLREHDIPPINSLILGLMNAASEDRMNKNKMKVKGMRNIDQPRQIQNGECSPSISS
ncbi:unnamed protein product [Sphenostylis stenocarpa]|uniref:Uncharacterized protein n=1 Tax=Sphenostylis stenocarpa TaxID=92480 RepID=A0AA86W2U2_9FABA|nr:unnamed protein product [Sphenostylis stenocarpa]